MYFTQNKSVYKPQRWKHHLLQLFQQCWQTAGRKSYKWVSATDAIYSCGLTSLHSRDSNEKWTHNLLPHWNRLNGNLRETFTTKTRSSFFSDYKPTNLVRVSLLPSSFSSCKQFVKVSSGARTLVNYNISTSSSYPLNIEQKATCWYLHCIVYVDASAAWINPSRIDEDQAARPRTDPQFLKKSSSGSRAAAHSRTRFPAHFLRLPLWHYARHSWFYNNN